MTRCTICQNLILFGGAQDSSGARYCGDACLARVVGERVGYVSSDVVDRQTEVLHQGPCPYCGGRRPVDVRESHWIYSVVFYTSWCTKTNICCRMCGGFIQVAAALVSGVIGWWGIPWGMIMTPVQMARNLGSMFQGPPSDRPSRALREYVREALEKQVLAQVKSGAIKLG